MRINPLATNVTMPLHSHPSWISLASLDQILQKKSQVATSTKTIARSSTLVKMAHRDRKSEPVVSEHPFQMRPLSAQLLQDSSHMQVTTKKPALSSFNRSLKMVSTLKNTSSEPWVQQVPKMASS